MIYGNVDLKDFKTNLPLPYIKERLNFDLPNSFINTQFGFVANLKDPNKPQFQIEKGKVDINNLQVLDKKSKQPIAKLDKFKIDDINFDYNLRSISLDSIYLNRFYANANINKDKSINLASLFNFESNQKSENPTKVKTSNPWDLYIDTIAVKNSSVDFTDNSLTNPFKTNIKDINFSLEEFTLKENDKFNYNLSLNTLENANFKNEGTISLSPLNIVSHYTLFSANIAKLKPYIDPHINFNINSATLNTMGDFTFSSTQNNNIKLSNTTLLLENMKLSPKNSTKNLVTLRSLETMGINFDLNDQDISIDKVTFNKLYGDVQIDKNKQIDLEQMFIPKKTKQPKVTTKAVQSKPWNLFVKQSVLKGSTVAFTDHSLGKPFKTKISQINSTINNISLAKNNKSKFNTTFRVNKRGKIALNGDIVLDPLNIQGSYKVSNLHLPFVQPYISDHLNIDLKKAVLYTNGTMSIKPQNNYFKLTSNISFNDLKVGHTLTKKDLLGVKKLYISALNLKPDQLKIKSVSIKQPQIIANIYEDRSTNFSQIVKEKQQTDKVKTKSKKKGKPFVYNIGNLNLKDGKMHFGDASLPFEFQTDIHDLQGDISQLSSDIKKPSKIDLTGQIDQYGLADIKGDLVSSDFKNYTNINLYFKNISMQNYTPYSSKFVGRKMAEGSLSLDLNYAIKDSQLEASNSIILEKLKLGDVVESKEAVNLPLELAIALLEDSDGIIDINLPITGDINDPKFSFAPIVWKAFGKLIFSIVASPFKLLGSLLGVDANQLSQVVFKPGEIQLLPPAKESLDKVIQALQKRPNLNLVLNPSYTKSLDIYALKEQKLDTYLLKELEEDIDDKDEVQDELENLYEDNLSEEKLEKIEQSFIKIVKNEKTGKEEEIFEQEKYISAIKDELVQIQKLESNALELLAKQRTQNISKYLIEEKQLESKKITIEEDVIENESKDKKWSHYKLDINIGKK